MNCSTNESDFLIEFFVIGDLLIFVPSHLFVCYEALLEVQNDTFQVLSSIEAL